MRIAVVTPGFSGSTLPLEKNLLKGNLIIDHYQIVFRRIHELESFPLSCSLLRPGVYTLSRSDAREVYDYIGSEKYTFKVIKLPRPYSSVPVIRGAIRLLLDVSLKKIATAVNKRKYDIVLFIGQYKDEKLFQLVKLIDGKKIVALHEVCNHRFQILNQPTDFLKFLSKNKIPVVVFSKNSYQDIAKYGLFSPTCIFQMKFGLFEGYSLYPIKNNVVESSDYILYIGTINSYKGLDILYNAVNSAESWPCKFVVAGYGSLDCLQKMKQDERFVVINRFLKNEEFAKLIANCKFVVCPYRSVSQSGIPQTAFLFDKPIVASDLEGFKEIIGENENGVLFEKENAVSLSKTMQNLLKNDALYTRVKNNIKKNFIDGKMFSWDSIADEYINLFNEVYYGRG